jgi:Ca-activated chloride channel family protein
MNCFTTGRTLAVAVLLTGAAFKITTASSPAPPRITPTPKTADTKTVPPVNSAAGELILRRGGKEVGVCPLQHTAVEANIAGFVARVHVQQKFRNTAKEPVEAIYTFPLPDDAAVDDMTMKIGKRLVKGQIKKREEARAIYEAAKSAGQAAALLDQERPNIFTQSVANLMPGEDVTIDISFVNTLKYDDGQYEWAFPTVVGPRYTGGSSAGQNPEKITPPIALKNTRAGHDISIKVNLDAGLPLQEVSSPLHPIDVQKQGARRAVVQLQNAATLPNKDFILRYKVAGERVQSGIIAYAPSGADGGYFTLILQPPDAPKSEEIAPKEMVFVIDQTGSQMGWPLEKAKETMRHCLRNLNPGDTFQLIGFTTEVFPCFPAPVQASKANVEKAIAWLEPIAGAGGTDILKAADYALKLPADPKRPRIICQMTDGYVGNDQEIIKHVGAHRGQARVFPFGVGNSVNRYLIDGMAREGRGVAQYVTLNEDGKAAAQKFYDRVAQPLLLDVSVDWGGLPVEDVLPRHIPDVFSSAPIILKGRYKRGMKGEIIVRGLLRGQPWEEAIPITLPEEPTESAEALPSLWAREKINDIEYEGARGNATETTSKVTTLALEYRLMSPYTSFVAVEQRVVNIGGKQRTINVPVEMPEGVSYEGIFGAEAKNVAALGMLYGLSASGGSGGGASRSRGATRATLVPRTATGQTVLGRSGTVAAGAVPASPAPQGSPGPQGAQGAPGPVILSPVPSPTLTAQKSVLENRESLSDGSVVKFDSADFKKQLEKMKPEERKATLRGLKLSAPLQKAPLPGIKNGRIEVQIWLDSLPADGLKKLKAAGFEWAATLTPNKLLLGTVSVAKLDTLLELSFVRRVEQPQFTS